MIDINKLNIRFKEEVIYDNLTLSVARYSKAAITGRSGQGKSTLLNALAGFVPFSGEVCIDGVLLDSNHVDEVRRKIAYLPQYMPAHFNTVDEMFSAPFLLAANKGISPSAGDIARVFDAFMLCESILKKKTKEISGGQRQRVLLASCLLLKKPLLLLDEPTSALDEQNTKAVTDFVMAQADTTVIAVTHDPYWEDCSDTIIDVNTIR